MRMLFKVAVLWCLLGTGVSWAQMPDWLVRSAAGGSDLTFPTEPSTLGRLSNPHFALYKPDGPGPFPAVVVHHQCGGLGNPQGTWKNMSVLEWAREAVSRGWVALVMDSLGPRGVDTVCFGPKGGVTYGVGARDALRAAAHLRSLPYVDKSRVGMIGFSWGGGTALMAASEPAAAATNMTDRFHAVVAVYPPCWNVPASGAVPPYTVLYAPVKTPLLVLMGDLDRETPAAECLPRLQAVKDTGDPVHWHVYPEAGHCWDCQNLDGRRKRDVRGTDIVYKYDAAITSDAVQRAFTFLQNGKP